MTYSWQLGYFSEENLLNSTSLSLQRPCIKCVDTANVYANNWINYLASIHNNDSIAFDGLIIYLTHSLTHSLSLSLTHTHTHTCSFKDIFTERHGLQIDLYP